MKKTTKILTVTATILLAFSLFGCNKSKEKKSTNKKEAVTTITEANVTNTSAEQVDDSLPPKDPLGTYTGKNMNWDPLKMELKGDGIFAFTITNEYSDGTPTDYDIYEGTYSYNNENGELIFNLEKFTRDGKDATAEMSGTGYYSYLQKPSKIAGKILEFADSGYKLKKN